MFPDELCQELSSLHASAPAHSWKFTQRSVEEALDIPTGTLLDVFESFESEPLASGSIAQVHRAVLKPDPIMLERQNRNRLRLEQGLSKLREHLPLVPSFGEEHLDTGITVAIKVRHPLVAELIDWDFRLMLKLADVVDAIPPLRWINIRSSVEQFSHTMAAQSHLNVEAHHLEVLNYNFRRWAHIGFPRPFYSKPTVICETFESGRIVTDIIDDYDGDDSTSHVSLQSLDEVLPALSSSGSVHERIPLDLAEFLVTNGLSIYLKMLLVDNLMHADLHPGNIMCCVNNLHHGKTLKRQKIKNKKEGTSVRAKKAEMKAKAMVGQVGGGIAAKLAHGAGCDDNDDDEEESENVDEDEEAEPEPFDANMILVDAGMVAKLDEEEADNFIGFLASLGEGNGRHAAEAALRFSPPGNGYDLLEEEKKAFIIDMEELFATNCQGYGTNVDVGGILRDVLQLIRKHKVRIDANYATLVINALCIEGLAKRVAPSYNVLDAAQPLLQSYFRICGTGRSTSRVSILYR
jgi:aarF domain-containing kinase